MPFTVIPYGLIWWDWNCSEAYIMNIYWWMEYPAIGKIKVVATVGDNLGMNILLI